MQALFRLQWLIDILVCMLLLEMLLMMSLYDVNGVMILLIITIIYVGVILLLVFIVSFLVDISVDRIYRHNTGGVFTLFIFVIIASSILDSEWNWLMIHESYTAQDSAVAMNRAEAGFL